MTNDTTVAAAELRAFVERIERVEEDIAERNQDKSEIYKEARARGYDVKVMRKVIAKRRLDAHEREEMDAVFEIYWDALQGSSVRVHARENIDEFKSGEAA